MPPRWRQRLATFRSFPTVLARRRRVHRGLHSDYRSRPNQDRLGKSFRPIRQLQSTAANQRRTLALRTIPRSGRLLALTCMSPNRLASVLSWKFARYVEALASVLVSKERVRRRSFARFRLFHPKQTRGIAFQISASSVHSMVARCKAVQVMGHDTDTSSDRNRPKWAQTVPS